MPKAVKICRICGNAYEACKTVNVANIFRWQDVACSPECGAKYLHKIQLSRVVMSHEDDTESVISGDGVDGLRDGQLENGHVNELDADT
jgi:hypothetical protein